MCVRGVTKNNVEYVVLQPISQEAGTIIRARCMCVSVTLPNSALDGSLVGRMQI